MPINPIQLPKWEQAPTVDWKPLNAIGDAIADNRRRSAEGEAFGGLVDAIPDRPERAPGAPAPGQPGRELPRGLRNNNPGNIEDGPYAKGMPGYKGSDGRFAVFETPEHGLGAMDALLVSYGRRGIKTVGDVVKRWAPKGDGANDPDAYARFVSSSGDPNEAVDLNDQAQRRRLIGKMAMFENGMQAGAPREGEAAPGGVAPAAADAYQRGMTPEMKERVRALFRVGTPAAVQAAMALTQKYLGKQEPIMVPAGGTLLDPNTYQEVGRGQPRVATQPKEKTYAELVAVPAGNVFPKPSHLSWHEAAAFPLVFETAYRMLVTRAGLRAGEWVLVWGIGGGVATACLRIAKALGARVIVTSSSNQKLEAARGLGADATVNHTGDVAGAVKEACGPGADVVVETVGEATWTRSLQAARPGGRIVVCGATSGPNPPASLHRIWWKQLTVLGSTMGTRADFAGAYELVAGGRARPVVDQVFPLADARAAHERLEAGEQFGKIVLEISG